MWCRATITAEFEAITMWSTCRVRTERLSTTRSISDPPNLVPPIVGHQQRSIFAHERADRPAPGATGTSFGDDPPRQKIFDRTRRLAVLERNKRDSIAGKFRSIPRSVKPDERTVSITLRKLRAGIKRQADGSRMRRQQNVRNNGTLNEVGSLTAVFGIVVAADV